MIFRVWSVKYHRDPENGEDIEAETPGDAARVVAGRVFRDEGLDMDVVGVRGNGVDERWGTKVETVVTVTAEKVR